MRTGFEPFVGLDTEWEGLVVFEVSALVVARISHLEESS